MVESETVAMVEEGNKIDPTSKEQARTVKNQAEAPVKKETGAAPTVEEEEQLTERELKEREVDNVDPETAERECRPLMREQKSDVIAMTPMNIAICRVFCGSCPSHKDCGEKELLFCSAGAGKNKKDIEPKGCNCAMCRLWWENKLFHQKYFCADGPAVRRRR